ncbi:peptidoglycan recognition protein family protein [Alteribacter keqinensis]|uniref:peptidoglycan recognition protein family protein n=1 Tax=Alteribacter keqinensis TaxID=2483800 RepID=UPI001605BE05|nr:N-acetylmuramoyl-L-alanine amidase [Alteribacter keqinensis]
MEKLHTHKTKLYGRRQLQDIDRIAIHHSGTLEGSAASFARYHVDALGWPGIGYHYVISKDGSVRTSNELETVSYHVSGSNRRAVGICLIGNFTREKLPTAQRRSAENLVLTLMNMLFLPVNAVLGHREFSGHKSNQCPGLNMHAFRRNIAPHSHTTLKKGDQGKDVGDLQQRLKDSGYDPGPVDGLFGPLTEKAVLALQKDSGIREEGIYGPLSSAALHRTPNPRQLFRMIPAMTGADVRSLQRVIGAKEDGIFGPETERLLKNFQKEKGLTPDGIAGPKTKRALYGSTVSFGT